MKLLDASALDAGRASNTRAEISGVADLDLQEKIGEVRINMSGCINACGHHHVGHIGVLGVDKQGQEFYQLTLGGSPDEDAALGEIVGKSLPGEEVAPAIERVPETTRIAALLVIYGIVIVFWMVFHQNGITMT